MTNLHCSSHLSLYFRKLQQKSPNRPLQVRVFSEKLDFTYPPETSDRPFHTASIGKTFTAVLVYRLAERSLLTVHDCLADHLPPALLERLFVHRGVDHAGQVTVDQLLAHTSGIADYFEGRTAGGKTFMDELLQHPDLHWTPQALLDYTRDRQTAVAAPGERFNYSDTGYILLGLLIEKLTGRSFSQNLADEFFNPLDIRDSYLMFNGEPLNTPKKELAPIWLNGVEVSRFESLSADWSGGGIVTTPDDLLRFSRALREGRLLEPESLAAMDECANRFRPGIYYGRGMMEIRFKEFFFLLGKLPELKGHIGILATHMFYDPLNHAHILMNFGDDKRMQQSFMALIEIENALMKLRG